MPHPMSKSLCTIESMASKACHFNLTNKKIQIILKDLAYTLYSSASNEMDNTLSQTKLLKNLLCMNFDSQEDVLLKMNILS